MKHGPDPILPPLAPKEYEGARDSIRDRGSQGSPCSSTSDGAVIDGHERLALPRNWGSVSTRCASWARMTEEERREMAIRRTSSAATCRGRRGGSSMEIAHLAAPRPLDREGRRPAQDRPPRRRPRPVGAHRRGVIDPHESTRGRERKDYPIPPSGRGGVWRWDSRQHGGVDLPKCTGRGRARGRGPRTPQKGARTLAARPGAGIGPAELPSPRLPAASGSSLVPTRTCGPSPRVSCSLKDPPGARPRRRSPCGRGLGGEAARAWCPGGPSCRRLRTGGAPPLARDLGRNLTYR